MLLLWLISAMFISAASITFLQFPCPKLGTNVIRLYRFIAGCCGGVGLFARHSSSLRCSLVNSYASWYFSNLSCCFSLFGPGCGSLCHLPCFVAVFYFLALVLALYLVYCPPSGYIRRFSLLINIFIYLPDKKEDDDNLNFFHAVCE